MHVAIASTLLLAGIASSFPTIEKRQGRNAWTLAKYTNKLYQNSPDKVYFDGWSEASQDLSASHKDTQVHSLVAFELQPSDYGHTCNLRFDKPDIAVGEMMFQTYEFVPENGGIEGGRFDYERVTYKNRRGKRGKDYGVFKVAKNDMVASFKCPEKRWLNYEIVPQGKVTNMQWRASNMPGKGGLWLEIEVSATPTTPSKKPVRLSVTDQVQVIQRGGGIGSSQFGKITRYDKGGDINTLIAFVMPGTDYSKRTCNLRWAGHTAAMGTKKFAVYEFTPNNGAPLFESFLVTWNDKRGKRGALKASYTVGDNGKIIHSFKCPPPGKGANFELAPSKENVIIEWNTREGQGPYLEVV